jgi:hypothetical protein
MAHDLTIEPDPFLRTPDGPERDPRAWKRRPGLAISLLVHGLAAFFLIYRLNAVPPLLAILPIEVVTLPDDQPLAQAAQTQAPLPAARAAAPARQASLTPPKSPSAPVPARPAIPNPPATTPAPAEAPRDELQTKLQGLAALRQPQTDPRLLEGAGRSADDFEGEGSARGRGAGYSVKDYIRAQVERRWNLDTAELGQRNFAIAIHVVLAPDGSVTKAEIVDQKRYIADAAYHSLAIAARNAVILSSPFALPSGASGIMDLTLDLNPRDTLR